MLRGPEHQLGAEAMTKKESRTFLEMLDDRVDIGGQLPVALCKDGSPRTPAVTSQVNGDSSKSSLGEISPNVNIAPRMFADTMNDDHAGDRAGRGIPPTAKKLETIH
jgi:hypothetical protein